MNYPVSTSLGLGLQTHPNMAELFFNVGPGDTTYPHSCTAGTLLTPLSPSPLT